MFLIGSEREKELQTITENLVAQNITGLAQAASCCPRQMGCKVFTQLQVQKLFTPHSKQVYKVWIQHLNPHVTSLKESKK